MNKLDVPKFIGDLYNSVGLVNSFHKAAIHQFQLCKKITLNFGGIVETNQPKQNFYSTLTTHD